MERRRLLEKAVLEGLGLEEEVRLPAELLEAVRSSVRAKVQEGLDSLDRGDLINGEAYFARWKKRLADHAASIEETKRQRGA